MSEMPEPTVTPDAPTLSPAERNELIERNLPLVQHVLYGIAAHFPRHADREELAQAATLGLVEAAHRFDPERGVPFDRWAALRVRGAILDAVRAIDFAPRSVRAASRQVQEAREALVNELHRTPTAAEVAERVGMSAAELAGVEGRVHRSLVLSLDATAGADDEDGGSTLGETVSVVGDGDPSELLERRELGAYLADALRLLPERLRTVVVGYFYEGRTSAELAEALGVTESRVSQLRTEAVNLLRTGLAAQFVPDTAAAAAAAADAPAVAAVAAVRDARLRRAATREATYAAAISSASSFRSRIGGSAGPAAAHRAAS